MIFLGLSKPAVLIFLMVSSTRGISVSYSTSNSLPFNSALITPLPSQSSNSLRSSAIDSATGGVQSSTRSGATIVSVTITATDGSDRSTAVTWSVVETGSTSTTDQHGHSTIISAPFWTCGDPVCVGTGCVLDILCSRGGGTISGFDGFSPPKLPPGFSPGSDGDSPSDSASPSLFLTGSALYSTGSVTSSGHNNAPGSDGTAAAATTPQPISTSNASPDPSGSAASVTQSAADASWSSAAATPSASCWITDDDGYGESAFEVYGINDWAGDDGAKLQHEEDGCGVLSDWQWHTGIQADFQGRPRDTQTASFSLSLFKGGCVERAVQSAGGPPYGQGDGRLACQHGGPSKRLKIRRALNTTLVERDEEF